MLAVDGTQYELQASLKAIDGERHDWSLRSPESPYPLSNKQDFKGRHFDPRNYQFDVTRDRVSHRYNLATAFSGFIPGEPRNANAIMTVAQRQADDTSLYVASGICDVETTRQPLS